MTRANRTRVVPVVEHRSLDNTNKIYPNARQQPLDNPPYPLFRSVTQRSKYDISRCSLPEVASRLYNYHNIFKIRYLIRIRQTVSEVLHARGLPRCCIRRSILSFFGDPFSDYTIYNSFSLTDTILQIRIRNYPRGKLIYLQVYQTRLGCFSLALTQPGDGRRPTRIQTLTNTYDIRELQRVMCYCFCRYNNQDTTVISIPTCLQGISLLDLD